MIWKKVMDREQQLAPDPSLRQLSSSRRGCRRDWHGQSNLGRLGVDELLNASDHLGSQVAEAALKPQVPSHGLHASWPIGQLGRSVLDLVELEHRGLHREPAYLNRLRWIKAPALGAGSMNV